MGQYSLIINTNNEGRPIKSLFDEIDFATRLTSIFVGVNLVV